MTNNGKSIKIVYLPLPVQVGGAVEESEHEYLVVINERSAAITQRHTLGHELSHIFLNHFTNGKPIKEVEKEANREAWHYYRAYRNGQLQNC